MAITPTIEWKHPGFASTDAAGQILGMIDPGDGTFRTVVDVDLTNGHTILSRYKGTGIIRADASVAVAGNLAVGVSAAAVDSGIRVSNTALATATQYGALVDITSTNAATTYAVGVFARVRTPAVAFTMGQAIGLYALNPLKGAGSTITTAYGLLIDGITAGATNYSIFTGAALSHFGGPVTIVGDLTIGVVSGAEAILRVNKITQKDGGLGGGVRFDTHIYPVADNAVTVGTTGLRFAAIYAANGTIQTSARKFKELRRRVDPGEAMQAIRGIPIYEYTRRNEREALRRFGPVLDEIPEWMRPNDDEETWVEGNLLAVNTAAIQAIETRLRSVEAENERLRAALHA